MAQRKTFWLKSLVLGIIRLLDANQYIYSYTFNQMFAMSCE